MAMKIALAGNPNCGKTTLFNALTGSNQFVGNWPGVTVEKKDGVYKKNKDVIIMDLPGTYSLSPYSAEEIVAKLNALREANSELTVTISGDTGAQYGRIIGLMAMLKEAGFEKVGLKTEPKAQEKKNSPFHNL